MDRRKILIALGVGGLAVPFASFAQQQGKVRRIGLLGPGSAAAYATWVASLRDGLREYGYIEGKNIAIEPRSAEGDYERLNELAAELVRLKVDVIVTWGTPGALAAKRATTTIPIVLAAISDPVVTGVVAGLARPGGNVTGSMFFVQELCTKRLEILRETFPRARRIGALINPDNASVAPIMKDMELTAKALKLELQQFGVRGPHEFESVISAMAAKSVDAIVIIEDAMLISNVKAITGLVSARRLVAIGWDQVAEAGGLMAYGVNLPEMWRRAAYFVDRIFKGAKPADLPIERSTRFELILNLKTAKALGIKFPQALLVRADRVIE